MNLNSILTSQNPNTQAAGKTQQPENLSQPFSDFLSFSGKSQNSSAVNPALKQSTALLGQLFNKTSWPTEPDISFSSPKDVIDNAPAVYETSDSSSSVDSVDDRDVYEERASGESQSDTSNRDEENTDAPVRESKSETERSNKETASDSNPDGSDEIDAVAAVVAETSQKAPAQVPAQVSAQVKNQAQQIAAASVLPQNSNNPAQNINTPTQNINTSAQNISNPAQNVDNLAQAVNNPAQATNNANADQKPKGTKAGVANTQVTQAEVVSKPTSNLIASATASSMSTPEAKVASSVNASIQEQGKGLDTASAATSVNGKGSTPGQTAQAVLAANPGQGGNNSNPQSQSQNGNGLAKAEIGAATGTKAPTSAGNVNFTEALKSVNSSAKPAPTVPTQSNLRAMNVTAADQLSIHIRKAIGENKDSISIKLHPSELGRVDIKLEIVDGNSIKALVTAERPETLELLQKDARLLEKALQEAGLKADGQSLSFNLKQNGNQQNGSMNSDSDLANNTLEAEDESISSENIELATRSSHDGDLDISI